MTTFKLFGAVLVRSAAGATPVLAQQVIQEPGAYAFAYPNGYLGIGSSRPAPSGPMAQQSLRNSDMHVALKPHKLANRSLIKR
jgi:hypothetical protein